MAVELDRLRIFRTHDFPRRAVAHPVVGQLDLVALLELLTEEAELVVNAVADRRVIQRGQRIEKTGRKAPQPAVAEPHVVLLAAQLGHVEPELGDGLLGLLINAGVIKPIGKEAAHEKLQRQIINPAHVLVIMDGLRRDHPLDDPLLHRLRRCQPPVPFRRRLLVLGQAELELMKNGILHRLGRLLEETLELGGSGHEEWLQMELNDWPVYRMESSLS